MAFKKVKLNYQPAIKPFVPKETKSVSNAYLERLDRCIAKRIKQNEAERLAGEEIAKNFIVK